MSNQSHDRTTLDRRSFVKASVASVATSIPPDALPEAQQPVSGQLALL
jgi:hypothetical protein